MGYRGARLAPWFHDGTTKQALVEMAEVGSKHLHGRIVELTPVDTGNLKQSWQITPLVMVVGPQGVIYERSVETHVDYAPYVEHGTGIWGPKHAKYVIRPKREDGYLHWISPEGQDVFAKLVMHPGSPGAHMAALGVSDTAKELDLILQPTLLAWARRTEQQNHSGLLSRGRIR